MFGRILAISASPKTLRRVLIITVIFLFIGIVSLLNSIKVNEIDKDYLMLLSKFSKDNQGQGIESVKAAPTQQPMTYGLILTAEALRFRNQPTDEGEERIRNAMRWLLDYVDSNRDGQPGWGLPQSWDAFSDGTTNPENHPYTITTAFVLQGMLDALAIDGFWKESELAEITSVIKETSLYWCNNVWTDDGKIGFFWYSISKDDSNFVPNVSSMFLGTLARFVSERGNVLSSNELRLINKRMDLAAKSIIDRTRWRSGKPFWDYMALEKENIKNRPNDLLHHTYILWGMELYRNAKGDEQLPWTKEQSLQSLETFWNGDIICEFPQDVKYSGSRSVLSGKPARLWGVGMLLGFYAINHEEYMSRKCIDVVLRDYGKFPDLLLYPQGYNKNDIFIARQAAHVLYGLAYAGYYK